MAYVRVAIFVLLCDVAGQAEVAGFSPGLLLQLLGQGDLMFRSVALNNCTEAIERSLHHIAGLTEALGVVQTARSAERPRTAFVVVFNRHHVDGFAYLGILQTCEL